MAIALERFIEKQIQVPGHEIVEVRTVEEKEETISFLLKIKKNLSKKEGEEGKVLNLYQKEGKLNIIFLERQARILIESKEYTLALNIYRALLLNEQRSARVFLGKAICEEARNKLDQAISDYEESIAYQPTSEAYERLGEVLLKEERWAYAVEVFERALKSRLDPNLKKTFYSSLSKSYLKLERFSEARVVLKKAIFKYPREVSFSFELGKVYFYLQAFKKAKACFEDVLAVKEHHLEAMAFLGRTLFELKDYALVLILLRTVILKTPFDQECVSYFIRAVLLSRKFEGAIEVLEKVIQAAPVSISILYGLAGICFCQKNYERTKKYLQRILSLDPKHESAKRLLRKTEWKLERGFHKNFKKNVLFQKKTTFHKKFNNQPVLK